LIWQVGQVYNLELPKNPCVHKHKVSCRRYKNAPLAPTCVVSEEWSNQFGSYAEGISYKDSFITIYKWQ
jgi:hypothetical protein